MTHVAVTRLARRLAEAARKRSAPRAANGVSELFIGFLNDPQSAAPLDEVAVALAALQDDFVDPRARLFEFYQAEVQAAERKARGVYYTPAAIVSFVVRAASDLFAQHFNAPPSAWVDPACGAGAFLSGVLHHHEQLEQSPPPVVGVEVDPATALVCQRLIDHPKLTIDVGNPLQGDCLSALGANPSPLIILGNPPYANFGRRNRSTFILDLLADYTAGLNERKQNLHDDFIKFIRWGQHQIEKSGGGVLAFVTSNTYLSGLTHRTMRSSLMQSFNEIRIIDLHGGGPTREVAAPLLSDQADDENVFDVRSGVALSLFVQSNLAAQGVWRTDLWGSKQEKLSALSNRSLAELSWRRLEPSSPQYAFAASVSNAPPEYAAATALPEMMQHYVSGVQTKNDRKWTDFRREDLSERMQQELGDAYDPAMIRPYYTAPFDQRWIYYDPALLGRARFSVMRHVAAGLPGFAFMRQATGGGDYDHFLLVAGLMSDRLFHSARGAPFMAPLELHEDDKPPQTNWRSEIMAAASALMCRPQLSPTDLFDYCYALSYSPNYRTRYVELLRRDFPRFPLTDDPKLFQQYQRLGAQLRRIHLAAQQPCIDNSPATILIDRPKYDEAHQCFRLNADTLIGATPAAATYKIGGCSVLLRWLKQRRGRALNTGDKQQFQGVIDAMEQTIQIERALASLSLPGGH